VVSLPRKELWAVHDSDVEDFLERLGLLNPIKEGKLLCAQCGQVVTLDSFGAAYPDVSEIKVVCDKLECLTPRLKTRL
jgi:hypothetical protein